MGESAKKQNTVSLRWIASKPGGVTLFYLFSSRRNCTIIFVNPLRRDTTKAVAYIGRPFGHGDQSSSVYPSVNLRPQKDTRSASFYTPQLQILPSLNPRLKNYGFTTVPPSTNPTPLDEGLASLDKTEML